jgi:hypothetical protein
VLVVRLALRAVRWRAAAAATVFAVALVAVLAATVGPIYLHSADETVLANHLTKTSEFQRDVLVSRGTLLGYRNVDWDAQVQGIAGEVGGGRLFSRPVSEQQAQVQYAGAQPLRGELASIGDLCAHVSLVRGRCLSGRSTDETLISANTAAAEHLTVGGSLLTTTVNGASIRLRVVGVYRPIAPDGSYWTPWDLFQFGQPAAPNQLPPGDTSFVTAAALTSRVSRVQETVSANVALLPHDVSYDDIGTLRTRIARVHATVAHLTREAATTGVPVATITTGLPSVLDQTAKETSLARTLVTVATAQLSLLAIFVLYAVVGSAAAAQGPEVALAKLRGRSTRSIVLQGVAQPVGLVLAAAPTAALLAWVLVRLLAAHLLGQRVDVTFPAAAYGVAALATAGGVLAAVVATRRIIVTPVEALLRRGAVASVSPTGLLVADAAAVTIAVAGLVELEVGGVLDSGTPNPLSVLTPALLALAGAVVVLRLLPFLARRLARITRDSRRVATFLAVRQMLRRPAEARPLLLVAVGLAIAAFAMSNWADAGHNRSLRALNSSGAHTVLLVRPGAGVDDLRVAVDRADPGGHSMAVAYTSADQLPPLIAVDTTRFASVGAWVSGNSSTPLVSALQRLGGSGPAPVVVTGTRLRLHVDLLRHPRQPVHLAVSLGEPNHLQVVRNVAPIIPGTSSYDIALPAACTTGCRIAALDLTANTPNNPYNPGTRSSVISVDIDASVRSAAGWRPVPFFGSSSRWVGDGSGPATVSTTGTSLSVQIKQTNGAAAWPSIDSAALPAAVPAVVASATAAREAGDQIHHVVAVGVDGQALPINGVVRSVTLPRVDRNGVMVDFGTALAAMKSPTATTTQYQVWLSPSAPSDMAARLAAQHVTVIGMIHASTYRSALDDSGPAFADSLFLIAAIAATVLAIGASAVARVVFIRRRGYELAALEAVGVSPRALRRAMAAEQGGVLGIGMLVGLAAGLVGSRLALPSTPVFVDPSTGPPLVVELPWALLSLLTVGLVVVFVVVSIAGARLVERSASPGQLRGAQQ